MLEVTKDDKFMFRMQISMALPELPKGKKAYYFDDELESLYKACQEQVDTFLKKKLEHYK